MLAVIYLLITIFVGYIFINVFTPYIFRPKNLYMHFARSSKLFPQIFVVFPASFSIGTVFSGWLLYISSYLLRRSDSPLFYGCIASFAVMILIIVLYLIFKRSMCDLQRLFIDLTVIIKQNIALTFFFCLVLIFSIWLMVLTFYVEGGAIRIGTSVFSDFAVHTAIIRSFSFGSNFPTQFPHFPDGTIRYHFMFQFFIGALEYMGLRMDIALNAMSITALFNAALLLYVTAVIVTNNSAVGVLTIIFFLFRSSFTGFRFLAEYWPFENAGQLFRLITGNMEFIGYTTNEEKWGLWNINVYANQRHFALGISLMLFGVIAMLPLMKKMYYVYEYRSLTFKERMKQFFFSPSAWLPESFARAVALGVLFGATAFFHGSAVIALLGMLAVMGFFSKHRLEFLIIAAITYTLASLQTGFFAPGVELAKPHIVIGFIAPDKSLTGILDYILMLTGVALIVALVGLIMRFKRYRIFFLIFLMPLIITFTLSLTPDVTVNHKFLMISMALLNIFAAYAICVIAGSLPGKLVSAVIIVLMVTTGVIDAFSVQNLNGRDEYGNRLTLSVPLTSPFQRWLLENTEPNDIILSAWHGVHEIFLTGRFEFFGWPYYAWSGGYDTYGRGDIFDLIVRPASPEECKRLIKENKISYILLDYDFYDKYHFDADYDLLKTIFPVVYSEPERELYVLKTN